MSRRLVGLGAAIVALIVAAIALERSRSSGPHAAPSASPSGSVAGTAVATSRVALELSNRKLSAHSIEAQPSGSGSTIVVLARAFSPSDPARSEGIVAVGGLHDARLSKVELGALEPLAGVPTLVPVFDGDALRAVVWGTRSDDPASSFRGAVFVIEGDKARAVPLPSLPSGHRALGSAEVVPISSGASLALAWPLRSDGGDALLIAPLGGTQGALRKVPSGRLLGVFATDGPYVAIADPDPKSDRVEVRKIPSSEGAAWPVVGEGIVAGAHELALASPRVARTRRSCGGADERIHAALVPSPPRVLFLGAGSVHTYALPADATIESSTLGCGSGLTAVVAPPSAPPAGATSLHRVILFFHRKTVPVDVALPASLAGAAGSIVGVSTSKSFVVAYATSSAVLAKRASSDWAFGAEELISTDVAPGLLSATAVSDAPVLLWKAPCAAPCTESLRFAVGDDEGRRFR